MPWIFHVARDSFLAGFASRFLERATQRRRGEGGCGEGEGKGNVIYKLLDPREEGALKEERVGSVTDKSPCCPRGEFSSDRVDVERMNAVGSPWNGRFPLSIHFFCLFPNSFPPFRIAYIHGIWNTMSFFGQPGN